MTKQIAFEKGLVDAAEVNLRDFNELPLGATRDDIAGIVLHIAALPALDGHTNAIIDYDFDFGHGYDAMKVTYLPQGGVQNA